MKSLSTHFKPKKNVPLARQTFSSRKTEARRDNQQFYYEAANPSRGRANMERKKTIKLEIRRCCSSKIRTSSLKLYRADTLTLAKLPLKSSANTTIKSLLILVPDNQCEQCEHSQRFCRVARDHKCSQCGAVGPSGSL
ncbi:hypothetical protein QZH41_016030, partial [Actinostola sp. cb2023]